MKPLTVKQTKKEIKGIASLIHDDFDRAILSNWACGFFGDVTMSQALIGAHVRRVLRNG